MAKADALKDAGNRYFKNEDYFRAIKCYKEGLQVDPGNPTLNCNLAQAYLEVKEFAEAEVHAVVTLAHQTDSVKGFYRATRAALGMANKERALSYLQTGLMQCPKAEELKTLYEEIKENGDAASCSNTSDRNDSEKWENHKESKTVHENEVDHRKQVPESERPSRSNQNKLRSRSTGSHDDSSSKTSADIVNVRSTSVSRRINGNSQLKKGSDLKNDDFLGTLVKAQSELSPDQKSPQLKEREALMEKKKKLQTCMREGSEAFEIGLAKQASEKYKCGLDIMAECNIEVFGMSEIDRIVLKYSLSICWIETRSYNNIVNSVGYLMEIKTNYDTKLPAVYYGLGQAFYQLNRYKVALDHLAKGVNVIENCINIIPHPWPGTFSTIPETTRIGLKESISKLEHACKMYHEPDAVCRYEKCLTVNPHICPSEIIFFSDPDFIGYVVIICQENCRIMHHVGCWKSHKEELSSVRKLADKDVLGQPCLTSDCINERNEISVIVRIEVYGDDGKIKTSCSKEPTKTDSVNEHRKERKKKNEKIERPVRVRTVRTRPRKLTTNSLNTVKKIKRKSIISSEEFAVCMQKLADLRKMNFGFVDEWNPQSDYFGRDDIRVLKTYLNFCNAKDSDMLKEKKDFIFTYFYEYLNDEGPQKISMLEKKWHEDVSQFHGIDEFWTEKDGICDFLLQSFRFACIDDYVCLANQMGDTYHLVQGEVGESIAFILNNSSLTVENHPDDSSIVDPCSNSTVPERPDSIATTSSEACSLEMQWNKRDSECDSFIIQDMDSESSAEEMDYDGPISTDSENEFDYENTEAGNYSNNTFEPKTLLLGASSTGKLKENDSYGQCVFQHPIAGRVNCEFQKQETKHCQSIISDIAIESEEPPSSHPVELKDVLSQTNSDVLDEMESLRSTNIRLLQEAEIWKIEKETLVGNYQKEILNYQQKVQMQESKISSLVAEKEEDKNGFLSQIDIKNGELEALQKKYQEQMEKHSKKENEDACLLKKNLENMTELGREVEKQTNTINRLEGQLRRSNEQVLNTRKVFGEHKLDSYLEKCKERLHCMNVMMKHFEGVKSPRVDEVKTAIEAWESVARELQDTKDLLQVQYDILSQQLKARVSSDCLLKLELTELPAAPHYPLQNMDNIIHLTLDLIQHKMPSLNGLNINETCTTRHTINSMDNAASVYPPSLLGPSPLTLHGELPGRMSASSFGFKTSFYGNNYNPFLENTTASQHFGPLCSNENLNNATAGSWPTEFCAGATSNDKPNRTAIGKVPSSSLTDNAIDPAAFNQLCQSVESLLSEETEIQGAGHEETEAKVKPSTSTSDAKPKALGEKKNTGSSGLTPIEITKGSLGDAKAPLQPAVKPANSEIKPSTRSKKRWDYQKLLNELQNNFKMISEAELSDCISIVREKNGNKLSGLAVTTILRRVEKLLEEKASKKVGNMGMDKFGGTAWGDVKEEDVNWQNDDLENECVICHINIENQLKTHLQCKHTFHTECIRQWLRTNSTCPICRKYTRLVDEFPPLA